MENCGVTAPQCSRYFSLSTNVDSSPQYSPPLRPRIAAKRTRRSGRALTPRHGWRERLILQRLRSASAQTVLRGCLDEALAGRRVSSSPESPSRVTFKRVLNSYSLRASLHLGLMRRCSAWACSSSKSAGCVGFRSTKRYGVGPQMSQSKR